MSAPYKLTKRDQKTVKRMAAAADNQELSGLVVGFNYAKMDTAKTLPVNQQNLAAWATVVDSHLVRNRSLTARLFHANGSFEILDEVRTQKTQDERRAAAAASLATGIAIGVAVGTI